MNKFQHNLLTSLFCLSALGLAGSASAQSSGFQFKTGYAAFAGPAYREMPVAHGGEYGLEVGAHAEWGGMGEWVGFGLVGELSASAYTKGAIDVPLMVGARLYIKRFFIGLNLGASIYDRQDRLKQVDSAGWGQHARASSPIGYSGAQWELYFEFYTLARTDKEENVLGKDENIYAQGGSIKFAWKF